MGASIFCADAEADTQFTIFDLSALKKQCLILAHKAENIVDCVALRACTIRRLGGQRQGRLEYELYCIVAAAQWLDMGYRHAEQSLSNRRLFGTLPRW